MKVSSSFIILIIHQSRAQTILLLSKADIYKDINSNVMAFIFIMPRFSFNRKQCLSREPMEKWWNVKLSQPKITNHFLLKMLQSFQCPLLLFAALWTLYQVLLYLKNTKLPWRERVYFNFLGLGTWLGAFMSLCCATPNPEGSKTLTILPFLASFKVVWRFF